MGDKVRIEDGCAVIPLRQIKSLSMESSSVFPGKCTITVRTANNGELTVRVDGDGKRQWEKLFEMMETRIDDSRGVNR